MMDNHAAHCMTYLPLLKAKLQEWLDWHEGPGETDSPLAVSTRELLKAVGGLMTAKRIYLVDAGDTEE